MEQRYDMAIIGSGPAGLSAAINAKIRNKKIILFGSKDISAKLSKAPIINNYLGFYNVSGEALKKEFMRHLDSMDIQIVSERVNTIYAMGHYFVVMVNEKMYETKTIILATGVEYSRLIKGETEFLGKGVGYCATCDAPLYKGKKVVVIGYNREGEEDVNFVSELAKQTCYIPMYNGPYKLKNKIEIIKGKPLEIKGDNQVKGLLLNSGFIEADGVFVLRDSVPPSQLVPGLYIEDGHIMVNRNFQTNIEGCFGAGDCIGKPYQYIKAAGEGQVAALNAVAYIDSKYKSK